MFAFLGRNWLTRSIFNRFQTRTHYCIKLPDHVPFGHTALDVDPPHVFGLKAGARSIMKDQNYVREGCDTPFFSMHINIPPHIW